ncbi:hypothetical protein HETIRDRAFT_166612 [Heterobasidion irregulare TC 32-1]|uniref:Yeast cell wall synthesis Kre9/Knh1-like N-terminal domain-containing protein n=1 Tax=Heterobasidion irregulare (strain TC 32-1) TaxID=747525 RepID=W4KPV1_HETIT|nr:uncharacterized protein HETIRDRAFT_166612 [Heterobasidion irregulare TC 32-1]ETW87086.1 hypothetical protein HETIRDRAFT_166612 [Heterobasidion irregulare TC 32-1]
MHFLVILSLATFSLAYQVTSPASGTSWSCLGPNTMTWTRAPTDPPTFAVVLVNDKYGTADFCAWGVDGSLNQTAMSPPYGRGQFIPGDGYHLNVVRDTDHYNAILAQSNLFSISQCETLLSSAEASEP